MRNWSMTDNEALALRDCVWHLLSGGPPTFLVNVSSYSGYARGTVSYRIEILLPFVYALTLWHPYLGNLRPELGVCQLSTFP